MTRIFKARCEELLKELLRFQGIAYQKHSGLMQNNLFQFTLKLTRKGIWKCQCIGGEPNDIKINLCTTSTTLLKRLAYLANHRKLEFIQDTENPSEFHIALFKPKRNKKTSSNIVQLNTLF